MNITADDRRLVTVEEVANFDHRLNELLEFAELADGRLCRVERAHENGGLPEGFRRLLGAGGRDDALGGRPDE